jgi:hypothetical protein
MTYMYCLHLRDSSVGQEERNYLRKHQYVIIDARCSTDFINASDLLHHVKYKLAQQQHLKIIQRKLKAFQDRHMPFNLPPKLSTGY